MHIFRNLFLLGAGATLFWAMRHRDELPQIPHASFSSILTQGSRRLSSVVANAGTESSFAPGRAVAPRLGIRSAGGEQIFFSPGQNLERVDVGLIDGAHSSIKIAMYAFTDRTIARLHGRSSATRPAESKYGSTATESSSTRNRRGALR